MDSKETILCLHHSSTALFWISFRCSLVSASPLGGLRVFLLSGLVSCHVLDLHLFVAFVYAKLDFLPVAH